MIHYFSTQLSLEGGDTVCIINFAFPMLLFLGKKSFAVGLTSARVPEDATEAFTVHTSTSQPGLCTQRVTKVLVQQLYGLAFTQATCKYIHCDAASVLAPAALKTWLDLVWAVLCLSVNIRSSAKAEAVAAAYATRAPALPMYLSHPGFTNHFATVLAAQEFNCKSHDTGWWF